MKKKISPLTYLIIRETEQYHNAAGYVITKDAKCEWTVDVKNKIPCTPKSLSSTAALELDNKITSNPTTQAVNEEISQDYKDYQLKGGKKKLQQWLDEDYYKTEEGKQVLEAVGKLGGILGGLFGEQDIVTSPKSSQPPSKIAGIKPIWLILIILGIVAALVGLFIAAGKGKGEAKVEAATASAPVSHNPSPVPAPQPDSVLQ